MIRTTGYGTSSSHGKLKPIQFERKEPRENEVQIAIQFCGVCHSDVHQARNEWKNTVYPCMPGHEIIGRVEKVGAQVSKFKVGETVGVGCMIDSCHECESCLAGLEQCCEKGFLATYNGNMKHPTEENNTFGGYSDTIVVRDDFVLKIPANLTASEAAPILCAGVTTYSPLKRWKVGPQTKLGVVGFGGLGQMAVKIAKAMGAQITVITTSPEKEADAKKLGADAVLVSEDKKQMKEGEASLDFILSTIPEAHDINPYVSLLKRDGIIAVVGCLVPLSKPLDMNQMITERRTITSSLIGGIAETQEVLDFCSQHKILPEVRHINIDQINHAFDDIDRGSVDFRYVIDMASLKSDSVQH